MINFHTGQYKSGAWLLEASEHYAADAGWQQADWRNAPDYGAFSSTSRPSTSADIPHPSKVKLSPAAAARAAATEDPENDPYGVLNGSGKNFEGLVNNIVSHHNNASPDTHYEGRVWYPAAHDYVKDLSDKSIHDPNRTAAVFASLSPQNDWDNNIEHGTHFMLNYNGQPGFGMPRILGGNVEKAKQIYHSPDENYGAILNGPKTRSFHHNIVDDTPLREPRPGEDDDAGYFQHGMNPYSGEQDWRMNPDQDVTADTHHARATSTPHGADLADARYQVPADFSYNAASGGAKLEPGYDLYNRATQEATRRVNAAQPDPARHLTPKQMQAIVWTKFKGDVDAAGKGRDFNPPGVPPKGLQKWLDRGKPEEEWAAKNPSVSEHPTIPRYQRERDPNYWTDQYRRPEPDIRHAPGYQRAYPVQKASAVANNGSLWGNILGSYIKRNPQQRATPRRTIQPRGNPMVTPSRLYHPHGDHVDTPGQITGRRWFAADHNDPMVGDAEKAQHRQDDTQDSECAPGQICGSRWFVADRKVMEEGGGQPIHPWFQPDYARDEFGHETPDYAVERDHAEFPGEYDPGFRPKFQDVQGKPLQGPPAYKPSWSDFHPPQQYTDLDRRTSSRWFIADQDVDGSDPHKKTPQTPNGVAPGSSGSDIGSSGVRWDAMDATPANAGVGKGWRPTSPGEIGQFGGGGGGAPGVSGVDGGSAGGGTPVNYTPSSGVEQWRSNVEEGLRRNNLPTTPDYVNRVLHQMQTESSGNPNAINNSDSNAVAGHPSQGLMQTIPSTFNQYHLPGDSPNINDPQANIDSAIGYGKATYGPTLMNSQGGGIGSGHGY